MLETNRDKSIFTRDNIESDLLKKMIIRIDFEGVVDVRDLIKSLQNDNKVKTSFSKCVEIQNRNFQMHVNLQCMEMGGNIPVEEIPRGYMFRFSQCQIEKNSEAILDVASNFICLTMSCNGKYSNSKGYSDFIAHIVAHLTKKQKFLNVTRIGIRKIDIYTTNNIVDLKSKFDSNLIMLRDWSENNGVNLRIYTDLMERNGLMVNYTQRLERESNQYKAFLDIDAYQSRDNINQDICKDENRFGNLLQDNFNTTLFEMFRDAVSYEYLESVKRNNNDA